MQTQNVDQPQTAAAGRLHYGFVVLGLILLVTFSALGLARFGYTTILPAMQEALHLNNAQTGLLQSCNLTGYLVTVIIAGMLATRYGPRRVIVIALLVAAAGMALTGLIPTLGAACVARFLAGVGGAGSNVPGMGLVSSWFGTRRRGMAAGIGVTGSSLGLIVTGPLIPAILESRPADGWRVSWYVLAGITLMVLAAVALFLRNSPADMGLRPIGESTVENAAATQPGAVASARQGWETVYRSARLWKLAAIYFAFGFSYIIYSTFFVRYLTKEAGFTLQKAGGLWFQVGVVSIVSGFIWGSVSDRWSRRTALLWVFGLQGLGFVLFGVSRSLPGLYASAALFALTAWSVPALMAALCGDLFGARLAPAALGVVTMVFGVGQVIGPYLAGYIADATNTFAPAFVVAGVTALVLGAGGSLLLSPSQPVRQSENQRVNESMSQ